MAGDSGAKQVFRLDKPAPEGGSAWRCDDCGTVIEGREGYDRHVACFPLHHPHPDMTGKPAAAS